MTLGPDIIEQCIGPMGPYHWIITLAVFMTKFPIAWHLTSHSIMVPADTVIYCVNTSMPVDVELTADEIKVVEEEACAAACPKIIVSKKYYSNSILNQYELYCERHYLSRLVQLLVMAGTLVGCCLFAIISDKRGRKYSLLVSCLGEPIFGTIVAVSPNVYCFLVFKFILNIFVGGTMVVGYVFFCEFAGAKWRPVLCILYHIPFILGQLSLVGFAYGLRDWRHFQIAISLPALLFSLYVLLPESPRWLLMAGKTEKAIKVLESVAKKNKLPTENIKILVEECQTKRAEELAHFSTGKVRYLFRGKTMSAITIGMFYNWLAVATCFYGTSQYSSGFSETLYLEFVLEVLLQLPGIVVALVTIPIVGRRWTLIMGNSIASVLLFSIIFVMQQPRMAIIPASIAMCGLATSIVALDVYTVEVFPTLIRTIGVGLSSSAGALGGMAAAATTNLKNFAMVPPLLYCILLAMGAASCFILPETRLKKFPDTIQDTNNLRKRREEFT